jgi:L-fuconolactonase
MIQHVIDSHLHIWNFARAKYAWLEGDTSILNRTYDINELNAERFAAGVTGGILVQAANNLDDTDWMLEVAANTNWIVGVVGWLPLIDPDATNRILSEKYSKNRYFKGVRHLIHNETDARWLLQENVLESLKIVAQYGYCYDIVGVDFSHIETTMALADKIPQLKMVFDHLNQPPKANSDKFEKWGILMGEAAKYPNLYVKISGLGTATGNFSGWDNSDLKPSIEFALKHFGTHRCFCGGDWPVSLLAGSYTKTWNAYQTILTELLQVNEKAKLLYDNAKHFYQL